MAAGDGVLMRRFFLDRQTDVSGTSGTGAVVEGVQFTDGTCVVHWLTFLSSFSWYKSVDDVVAIHGHGGQTNLHWIDPAPWVAPEYEPPPAPPPIPADYGESAK